MNSFFRNIAMRATPEPTLPPAIPKSGVRDPLSGGLIHPLDVFYQRAGLSLPLVERIEGPELPEPYRSLLVHAADMTPTLKRFHGQNIHLRVMSQHWQDEAYFREVVLVLDGDERPVEFGAIRINLPLFGPEARQQILGERLPLGDILQNESVRHTSRPKAFFRVSSDAFIARALRVAPQTWLYGRRNTLFDLSERSLAEIVEILPP